MSCCISGPSEEAGRMVKRRIRYVSPPVRFVPQAELDRDGPGVRKAHSGHTGVRFGHNVIDRRPFRGTG